MSPCWRPLSQSHPSCHRLFWDPQCLPDKERRYILCIGMKPPRCVNKVENVFFVLLHLLDSLSHKMLNRWSFYLQKYILSGFYILQFLIYMQSCMHPLRLHFVSFLFILPSFVIAFNNFSNFLLDKLFQFLFFVAIILHPMWTVILVQFNFTGTFKTYFLFLREAS